MRSVVCRSTGSQDVRRVASHLSRLAPYLDRTEPAPTLLKMLVGVQLAGIREDLGLSQDQAARAVGFSPAKLSRIEAGKSRRPSTESDVRTLLEYYRAEEYEGSALLQLLRRAGEPGWWQRYDKRLMPEWFDRLVGLQEAATAIRTFELQYIPGLLQTETTPGPWCSAGCPWRRPVRCSAVWSCARGDGSCCTARRRPSCGRSSTSRCCCVYWAAVR
ncbi:transcriptional regulator with XRE-family HTH domain [Streptomyces sp. V4I8]